MPAKDQGQEVKKRNAPLWVKIFVPLHIIAITSWSLPDAPAQYVGDPPKVPLKIRTDSVPALFSSSAEYLRTEFLIGNSAYVKQSPLKFYLLTTGFWQYWDMFSPNPSSVDIYADAVITYADGTKKRYDYPRMYKLSIGEKFLKERWRKFYERAGSDNFRFLWPDFVRYLALMNDADPRNPPKTIELHRHEMAIRPPGVPENKVYTDIVYYTQAVDQERLRKDKGQ